MGNREVYLCSIQTRLLLYNDHLVDRCWDELLYFGKADLQRIYCPFLRTGSCRLIDPLVSFPAMHHPNHTDEPHTPNDDKSDA